MSSNTNWWDVLGSDATAQQIMAQFEAEHRAGETLAEWLKRTSEELWGETANEDWERMARQLKRYALAATDTDATQRYEWVILRFFTMGSRALGEVKLTNCTDEQIQAAADEWTRQEFPSYKALPRWGLNSDSRTNEFGPGLVLYTISQTN